MKMLSVNRLLWLFLLLCVAALAISSVHSLTEKETEEEFFEEGSDYEGQEENDVELQGKPEFSGPPPTAGFPQPPLSRPLPPVNYGPPLPPSQLAYAPVPLPPPPPPQLQPQLQPAFPEPAYLPLPPPPVEAYAPPQQDYQAPTYEAPAANYSPPAYQQPLQPQPVYQTPVANYTQPAYQPPLPVAQPTYQPIQAAPIANYSQPQVYTPVQQPLYQPVAPVPLPIVPVANYSQPAYQPPKQTYQPVPVANYSAPPAYNQQQAYAAPKLANYSVATTVSQAPQRVYSPASLAQKYSFTDLAPFTTPFDYRGNHIGLYYYRSIQRTNCPKQMYANGPSYKDIEAAFAYALGQLGLLRPANAQYLNSSAPSFAARHQIFSYLSQQNARMDEEGLLVEFVGQFLADRLCMTKWDKQRYLPTLTRIISAGQFPNTHSCSQYYSNPWQNQGKNCYQSKYRTYDGFCNNPYHPYWGKANVCHIRLLSPDYADGIALPRESQNGRFPLPNPRLIANIVHPDVELEGPYNLMKMQWGQFINHDITNTALSSYDGLVDCCKQPQTRGCWPIYVPPGDRFYAPLNVTCLNFIRSGVCPTCQLGPRQQTNKNTAFLDASHIYGNNLEQAKQLRTFVRGQLRTSGGRNGEQLLPIATSQEQCTGVCYQAGDSRVNQHPALTVLHTLLLRNHNRHAYNLALRHPNWNDETLYQEARRITIAEYQMITFNEYLPIVFGPILSAYFQLTPTRAGFTQYNPQVDPTTWNEYTTAACRFGHSQIRSQFGLYTRILGYGQQDKNMPTFRLREWFMRPSLLADGQTNLIINGLLGSPSYNVDPWISNDVRNHLYQAPTERFGGDLAATNIWRGRDHGLPAYVHYLDYCFNYKVRGWKELQLFIPNQTLNQLRKLYKLVENIDLFTGGLAERHFPGADIGPTFACINGIQYNHLKFGDRFYFEHGNQVGSFNPAQLDEIKRASLARLLCRTASLPVAPQYAFLQPSLYNPLINCNQVDDIDYSKF